MPDQSTILSLPHILPSQAQKHVTHNEALRLLDVMVQLSVLQRSLNVPPVSPVLGDRYIVAASPAPTGAWAGHGRDIALWNGTAWEFFEALKGWRAYVGDEAAIVVYDGTNWLIPSGGAGSFSQLGVAMSADATNKLAVLSEASLFTNPAGSHRLAINKGDNVETASTLFQQDYQTFAEIGLLATNDLSIKVSANGTTFSNAITVDKDNGGGRCTRADGRAAVVQFDDRQIPGAAGRGFGRSDRGRVHSADSVCRCGFPDRRQCGCHEKGRIRSVRPDDRDDPDLYPA
jgi:hypothetical protein